MCTKFSVLDSCSFGQFSTVPNGMFNRQSCLPRQTANLNMRRKVTLNKPATRCIQKNTKMCGKHEKNLSHSHPNPKPFGGGGKLLLSCRWRRGFLLWYCEPLHTSLETFLFHPTSVFVDPFVNYLCICTSSLVWVIPRVEKVFFSNTIPSLTCQVSNQCVPAIPAQGMTM